MVLVEDVKTSGQATLHCGGLRLQYETDDIQLFLLLVFSYSTEHSAVLQMKAKQNFMSSANTKTTTDIHIAMP